jgi:hypothetical protein
MSLCRAGRDCQPRLESGKKFRPSGRGKNWHFSKKGGEVWEGFL